MCALTDQNPWPRVPIHYGSSGFTAADIKAYPTHNAWKPLIYFFNLFHLKMKTSLSADVGSSDARDALVEKD